MIKQRKLSLDPALEKYYSESRDEFDRLNTHRLEKDRTLQILKKLLPPSPAVVLDIGGAVGVYSLALAAMGYKVHLIDPIPLHVEEAKKRAKTTRCQLARYCIGDARQLEQKDNLVEVVLLFGPLYHLIKAADRDKALQEAYRVLKPGGFLFATGITRIAAFMDAMHKREILLKYPLIKEVFRKGILKKAGFTFAYLHFPDELKKEVQKNGFTKVSIKAIEGPVWEKQLIMDLNQDEKEWKKVLSLLEKIETDETAIGASAHIMAVGRKPKKAREA